MWFQFDTQKDLANQEKHGVSFKDAKKAFQDPHRIFIEDQTHSSREKRYFCVGKVSEKIMTVRFTLRGDQIRIFGAAYWRKGKKIYEKENTL